MSDVLSAPLFVAAASFLVARVDFQVGVLAPEDSVSVSNLPLQGFTAGC